MTKKEMQEKIDIARSVIGKRKEVCIIERDKAWVKHDLGTYHEYQNQVAGLAYALGVLDNLS